VMRNVDFTLSYSAVEHAVILSHNLASTRVFTAPWIVDVADTVPDFEARADVAFLGGFGHPPNAEAAVFFAREVMPLLRLRVPAARFLVYGSGIPPELEKQLAAEGVEVKGFVENLAEVYGTCRVFVAPLLTGAGVKGKVVDALSFGVPTVMSPVAAEGIALSDGTEAVVARSPAEWVEAVAGLYTNADRWDAMSHAALAFARRNYSFERGVEQMRAVVEAAGVFAVAGMAPRRARLGL
jgi:O-antigen biosynthesis protein